jgi:hypothetical protein
MLAKFSKYIEFRSLVILPHCPANNHLSPGIKFHVFCSAKSRHDAEVSGQQKQKKHCCSPSPGSWLVRNNEHHEAIAELI